MEGTLSVARPVANTRWTFLYMLEAAALVVAILYWAQRIIIPLALAVLLTFILSPIVARAQRAGSGRVPAVFLVVTLVFLILGGIGWGVSVQIEKLATELPQHTKEIGAKLAPLRQAGQNILAKLQHITSAVGGQETPSQPRKPPSDEQAGGTESGLTPKLPGSEKPIVVVQPESPSNFDLFTRVLGPVLEPLGMAGLVVILVIFMLITREDLRNRLIRLLGMSQLPGTTKVFEDTANRLSRFLLAQVIVNACFGCLIGIGLFFIGVPFALLWGLLAAVLRFIPYLGVWLAAALPLLLSLAIAPSWTQPLVALALFIALDVVTANVVEPLLFGHSTGVSPLALLVAAAFWTWIWGPIGLLLSTPLTVCLVVLGRHVPSLRFLAVLLSDQPALTPAVRYYQRMLAKDQTEAREVALAYARDHSIAATYDEVLIPALSQARHDRHREELTAEEETFVYEVTHQVIEDLTSAEREAKSAVTDGQNGTPHDGTAADEAPLRGLSILACPAHHESEELILEMLRQLLEPAGCRVEVLSTKVLPSDALAQAKRDQPTLVYIATLPPSGLTQCRYLCQQFRKQAKDRPIVVGYWGNRRRFDMILVRLRAAGASYVNTTLRQSRGQIASLLKRAASHVQRVEAAH
jgi:predicted PurR-regulated permease PerM